ncbi:lantibiotic dehydratase [Chitinophaga pinensis]|uniref:Lantibiotic dehydratase domain protein n=1 Tax=Chitinophaga pinensis (strain ATCC 43595 / DSM 2588 / LMG 13176 / NBRC 15968 / NCIMB 11800 / UQM 2034) TaxID=485918 RepID=A0A979G8A9_CHIPD|nr:lantibiotic dehydratase [Chitinophaga pinensis]ACU62759.1 Lantibiotic dehydratase domain protein [Chitinophaga pinensis DSM 2588]
MALSIFPHILVRYAGMPLSVLHTAKVKDIADYLQETAQSAKQLAAQKEAVCDLLYTAISQSTDDKERRQLLQLKRDIFNDKRPVKLPAFVPETMKAYLQQLVDREKEEVQWRDYFEEKHTAARRELQGYVQDEALRKGILLSSPVLYEQLDSFALADSRQFKSRTLKNEHSLIRYISRMAAKTSPFSTFTYTGLGKMGTPDAAAATPEIHSDIRLHNGLFSYIRLLIIYHPVLNEIITLRLNVTATIIQEELQFLVNYFNVEAFQRLPARNLPLWLYHQLQDREAIVTLGGLTDQLCSQIADTDRSAIKSFLLQLVFNGLLEPGIGCAGIDPDWDGQLLQFLTPYADQQAVALLLKMLSELQQTKTAYAIATADRRHRLLLETAGSLEDVFRVLQEEAGLPDEMPLKEGVFELFRFQARRFLPQDIFYEDAFTDRADILPATALSVFTREINQLCTLLAPLDALAEERAHMQRFFVQHYDEGAEVPVTRFYHDYYLQEKKQATDQQAKKDIKEIHLPDTLQLVLEQDTVHITPAIEVIPDNNSAGAFVQFYQEGSHIKGVINALLPGMGKVAGRFLHLLPPVVTADFRTWNKNLYTDHLLLELNDGSAFNANIHPPLLPYEVAMPGGNNIYAAEARVSLKDLVVKHEPATRTLSLFHKGQNKPVYAFDLSLESFYNRSHFYRLLAHFNTVQRVPLRAMITALDRKHATIYPPNERIQVKPRITFGEQVVLRRKGWLLQTAFIPLCGNEESAADYFKRLNTWRIENDIPEQCFLFLRSAYIPVVNGQKSQLQRDDYKPQYMDFSHPLLATLFRKVLSRAGEWCYLEEMLPAATHVAADGGVVKEYLLHWYNR